MSTCSCGEVVTEVCLEPWRRDQTPITCAEKEAAAVNDDTTVCAKLRCEQEACSRLSILQAEARGEVCSSVTREDRPDQFGPCGPIGQGNQPITDDEYQCSLGVSLQGVVDIARRVNHELGLRPYRVFLVWQARDRFQRFQEIKRIELVPVKVSTLTDVDLQLSQLGAQPVGNIMLSEVSPNQVNESDLRGLLDGRRLEDGEEFFYEVVRMPRCDDETVTRGRFTLGAVPYLEGKDFGWKVSLVDQENPRGTNGEDQAFEPTAIPALTNLEILRR